MKSNPILISLFLWLALTASALPALGQIREPEAPRDAGKYTVSGYVRDSSSGEELINATVYVKEAETGALTNAYGFYSLTLPEGKYTITASYFGFAKQTFAVDLTSADQQLNIELPPEEIQTDEIEVTAEREDANVQDLSMSVNSIDVEQVKKLPSFLGEPDIIKNVQLQPGVLNAGEGTSGYFVRGGSADQNLILIDEAPVYDPTHVFGLFSVFNADVIKDSDLYKGGIPAQYGGRLSSILDVRTRDGNAREFSGAGTVGLLMSKLTFEGPIIEDKSSFLVSARRSQLELFFPLLDESARDNNIHFYDINAKVNFKPNNKNRFFVASYIGRDKFRFGDDAAFGWGNATGTFRWNHLFSDRFFSNTTLIFTNFDYKLEVDSPEDPTSAFDWTASLQALSLKQDMTYYINPKNTLNFGLHATYRAFAPGNIGPASDESIFTEIEIMKMYAMDYAAYIGNEHKITKRLSMEYGIRLSAFQSMGPGTIYDYAEDEQGLPDNEDITKLDTTEYGDFETMRWLINPEPRINVRYLLSARHSLKASYNRMAQNIHLLSNSTVPVPFNTWTPSSPYLDSQLADQVALGYFRNFKDNMFEFSAEVYYKSIQNVTEFADLANLLLNPDAPVEYRQGDAESYGLELMVNKKKGDLTGFANYTLSRTEYDIPGVNDDQPFFANFDRRHSVNFAATYELDRKWTFGAIFTYQTGRPFTLAAGRYQYDGYVIDLFSERNGYRLPDYHRLDFSAVLTPKKNADRWLQTKWTFAVYNAYMRKNVFTYFSQAVRDDEGNVIDPNVREYRMLWLFGLIPSVSYTLSF